MNRPNLMAVAATLALLMRLLVPAGFMPATQGAALVLCSGQAMAMGGKQLPGPASHASECPFAAAAMAGTAPEPAAVIVSPAAYAAAAPAVRAGLRIGQGLGRAAQPATGPPARA